MSLHPKDDALPTATRLRVLVALPLLIVLVVFLVYLDFKDWTLRSPNLAKGDQPAGERQPSKRKRTPRPALPGVLEQKGSTPKPASIATGVEAELSRMAAAQLTEPEQPAPQPLPPPRAEPTVRPLLLVGDVPVLTGKVTLLGKPPAETPIPFDAMCSRTGGQPSTTRHYAVNSESGMADVVVSFKGVEAHLAALTPVELDAARPALLMLVMSRKLPEIEQRRCEFVPYVSATLANADILVRNTDPVLHTASATPSVEGNLAKRFTFTPGSRFQTFSFQKPEEFLRIKCDVHPWMFAYVTVFDHTFFDVSDTNGVFRVPLPPPGRYVLQAVHRKAGRLEQEVEVRRGESPVVSFVFELK